MRKAAILFCSLLLLTSALAAQGKRLWVLRAPGEMVEYDPVSFVQKQIVKVPAEAVASPQNLSVNRSGQMLFAPPVSLPLADEDLADAQKVWLWDGHSASAVTRDVSRSTAKTGSNLAVTESAPIPCLSNDGAHLFWFSNQARRLQRENVDLSTRDTWSAWQTDLAGAGRQDLASLTLPECSCRTGSCEESCPLGKVWVPEDGVGKFFALTQSFTSQTETVYKSSSIYQEAAGKWAPSPVDPALRRVLDAANATTIVEALPDKACCGWANQSNDQTQLRRNGKALLVFDELATYNNADYDVSFYTDNGKLSPDLGAVAFTIVATAEPNKPIQLAEQGQANPEESQRIRKALADLPAVEVKSVEDAPRRLAFLPHASLVGWISEKEILVVEGHLLVAYNVITHAARKSSVRVDDAGHAFVR